MDSADISGTSLSDRSGNGNNGVIHEAASASGLHNEALSFDGIDDYVEVSPDDTLSTASMTISTMVYIPDSIDSGWQTLVEHDRYGENWYGLYKSANGDKFHFRWCGSGTCISDFNAEISPNTWYHVVGTYDASTNTATMYQDGYSDSSVTGATSPLEHNGNLRIGRNNDDNEEFRGLIDDVRIYDRALSPQEVQDLLEDEPSCGDGTCNGDEDCSTCSLDCPTPEGEVCCSGTLHTGDCCDSTECDSPKTCINYWCAEGSDICQGLELLYHMDEDSSTVRDLSGNGNTGTVHGAAWTSSSQFSGGFAFDGEDDYIMVPGLLGEPEDITISVWARVDSRDSNGASLISMGDNLAIIVDSVYGSPQYTTRALIYNGGWNSIMSGVPHAGTGWHHYALTFDDSGNSQAFYVDGKEAGSTSFIESMDWRWGSDTYIGKHGDGGVEWDVTGVIDEVVVWTRALSLEEIQGLAASDLPLTCYRDKIHECDSNPQDGCVEQNEMMWFIGKWHLDSTNYLMSEMMEAITIYYAPGYWCP